MADQTSSPFDLLEDFRVSQAHLLEMHNLNPQWVPKEEVFEDFLARVDEIHVEDHTEASPAVGHTHRVLFNNGCPECGGFGWVVAQGLRRPTRVECPECAGLAIRPASVDEVVATRTASEHRAASA